MLRKEENSMLCIVHSHSVSVLVFLAIQHQQIFSKISLEKYFYYKEIYFKIFRLDIFYSSAIDLR